MSNPVATIGDTIPTPSDPKLTRKTYTRIVFSDWKFLFYSNGETTSSFDPTDKGDRFYVWKQLDQVSSPAPVKPDFVTTERWNDFKHSSSGFMTAVNSIMPKMIVPSMALVSNGLISPNDTWKAMYNGKELFNWTITSFNGSVPSDSIYNYVGIGTYPNSQYISAKAKDDARSENTLVLHLDDPADPPTGNWKPDTLVGYGAFQMMVNIVPCVGGKASTTTVQDYTWSLKIQFGGAELYFSQTDSMRVKVYGEGSGNELTVNLAEAKAKGGSAQGQYISEKEPYIILVYNVWDGIVVSAGVQDAANTVIGSSYYIPKYRNASIFVPPYSNGFDPTNPADVEVDIGSSGVDFGTDITVTAINCRFELAYTPCFFTHTMRFDEWFVVSDDVSGTVSYAYKIYPIWTSNGTSYDLDPTPNTNITSHVGPIDDTHYAYVDWGLKDSDEKYTRKTGEIFGSILETRETRDFPIKNGNGNFALTFTPSGGGAGSSSDWVDYIQSINVSVGLDGSSGSITVDKYGVAAQDAEVVQSVGAVTIDMTGGFGTQAGRIFSGLAYGIEDARSTDGATVNINLVGLEKKMDDIALINVPFMDGETLATAADFLCRYAGILYDLSNADPNVTLQASEDINVARYDWKSGTTVRSAVDDIMGDILHHWVIHKDGVMYFYELNPVTGLPITLGTDWEPSYPGTKVVSVSSTSDFEDLRNEIVVLALDSVMQGQGSNISTVPMYPRVASRQTSTTPDIPWARTLVRPVPGFITQTKTESIADSLQQMSQVYELVGRLSIPGNGNIKPYDMWGNLVIISVSHTIDLQGKTWTTDLEFMRTTSS